MCKIVNDPIKKTDGCVLLQFFRLKLIALKEVPITEFFSLKKRK